MLDGSFNKRKYVMTFEDEDLFSTPCIEQT